jgi:hypothetical protein
MGLAVYSPESKERARVIAVALVLISFKFIWLVCIELKGESVVEANGIRQTEGVYDWSCD